MMPMASCTRSCCLQALRRPETSAASFIQRADAQNAGSDAEYAEQDDVEGEEHKPAVSSPCFDCCEHDEEALAFEREELEAEVVTLQLQVRTLRKYKANYELLCGQLGELNAQIVLQLQRHEADVTALQTSIADLQTDKISLERQVVEAQQALAVQREAAKQDLEYSEDVDRQLSTAAELLKATEKRLEQQKELYTADIERLKTRISEGDEEQEEYQRSIRGLKEELEAFREREAAANEKEMLRRRREKSKRQKELVVRAAKLRAVSDELESQRSVLRSTKKQLAQVQAENESLRKQLTNVKRDGAQLSDIIDSQRAEHESYTDELLKCKKAKKQLAKRVAVLSYSTEQLQNELAEAKEDLVDKTSELADCRDALEALRTELRHTQQILDEVQGINEKLVKRVETFQKVVKERNSNVKAEEQRTSQKRKYREELLRMHELLADKQQRATESSKDVQNLRRELLGVQKLLHGCTQDVVPPPIDQWAEMMRNSVEAEESELKNAIIKQVQAFNT